MCGGGEYEMSEQVVELPAVDGEGQLDHGDVEPTADEIEEGDRQARDIDPYDDDDGGEPA
jgi:hypothetical protein